jgi:hypothetical protein
MSGLPRIRNLSNDPVTGEVQCELITSAALIKTYDAPVSSLAVMSSIIGNDYYNGVKGLGTTKTMKIVGSLHQRNVSSPGEKINLGNSTQVLESVKRGLVDGVSLKLSEADYQSSIAGCRSGVVGLRCGPVRKKETICPQEKIKFIGGVKAMLTTLPAGVTAEERNRILNPERREGSVNKLPGDAHALAHGQRHDALSSSRSNVFLLLEQMMLEEVLAATASLPNDPFDVDFGFIDNASGLRASLFKSLHEKAAARGEVARLTVTRTENTRKSDVSSFKKDIMSLGFDAVFELLGVAEGDPLYLLAEGFDGDCSRPVSHSFRLRVSRLRDKNERCYGYTVRGAWSMIEDNVQSLVFFVRNGRLCFGQALADGIEFVFPPATSPMLVHVETGTLDVLFRSLLDVLLDAAGASTELGSLGVQQGELFSRFSGVGYTEFVENKDLIGENLAEHRSFFSLYEHRKIYTVGCMSAINYFIKMGCPYFQKDPGEVLDFLKWSFYSGVAYSIGQVWSNGSINGQWEILGGEHTSKTSRGAADIAAGKQAAEELAEDRGRMQLPIELINEALLRARNVAYGGNIDSYGIDEPPLKRDADGVDKPPSLISNFKEVLNEQYCRMIAKKVVDELSDEYMLERRHRRPL